jgi:hypothetical protein
MGFGAVNRTNGENPCIPEQNGLYSNLLALFNMLLLGQKLIIFPCPTEHSADFIYIKGAFLSASFWGSLSIWLHVQSILCTLLCAVL